MEINIKESSIIRPAKETPQKELWVSDMDLIVSRYHVPLAYFYKQQSVKKSLNFFEPEVLKSALSEVLVAFYPLAGRLGKDENGRIQINCNGSGALFIEAETSSVVDDFGDFTPCEDMLRLVPSFDSFSDISSYPLFAAQLTRFRCGSVCIGVCLHHIVVDGISASHFMNSWAAVARGSSIVNPPYIDRTLLAARDPPSPKFHHSEYDPPLTTTQSNDSKPILTKKFNIPSALLATLRSNFNNKYSTYEILSAHIWYCVCKARELSHEELTTLYVPTNGRLRFVPPLPKGFFGNAQFITTVSSSVGEIQSRPLVETIHKIHSSIKKLNGEYLRSGIDFLKMQPDVSVFRRGAKTFRSPNLDIVSWINLPFYDADFGWGRPLYFGRVKIAFEGMAYLTHSPKNDKSLSLVICLHAHRMTNFGRYFNDFSRILRKHPNL